MVPLWGLVSMSNIKKGIQSHTCLLQFALRRGDAQARSVRARLSAILADPARR